MVLYKLQRCVKINTITDCWVVSKWTEHLFKKLAQATTSKLINDRRNSSFPSNSIFMKTTRMNTIRLLLPASVTQQKKVRKNGYLYKLWESVAQKVVTYQNQTFCINNEKQLVEKWQCRRAEAVVSQVSSSSACKRN